MTEILPTFSIRALPVIWKRTRTIDGRCGAAVVGVLLVQKPADVREKERPIGEQQRALTGGFVHPDRKLVHTPRRRHRDNQLPTIAQHRQTQPLRACVHKQACADPRSSGESPPPGEAGGRCVSI